MAMAATAISSPHPSLHFSPAPPLPDDLKPLLDPFPLSTGTSNEHCLSAASSLPPQPILSDTPSSFASALERCAATRGLREGTQIHARLLRLGFLSCNDRNLFHSLLLLYSAARPAAAAAVLSLTPPFLLTPFAFNIAIRELAAASLPEPALHLFLDMLVAGLRPNEFTFPVVLRCAALLGLFSFGQQLHTQLLKSGFSPDNVFCATALLNLYAKVAPMADACKLFDRIPNRSEATWNSMITALVEKGFLENGMKMLQMMEEDGIEVGISSWNAMLAGCVRAGQTELAFHILEEMASSAMSMNTATFNTLLPVIPDIPSLNWLKEFHAFVVRKLETTQMNPIDTDRLLSAVTSGYCLHRLMDYASRLFETVRSKSPHLCTSMISGFLDCKRINEAFRLFREMAARCGFEVKTISRACLTSILPECSSMSKHGLEIHAYVIRKGLDSSTSIGNALMAMYAKRDDRESICKIFQRIIEKDLVSWNTMAAAHDCDQAFELFQQMLAEGFEPDEFSFSSVLNACGLSSHFLHVTSLHGRMVKSGFFPSFVVVQNALMDAYGKCGCICDAKKTFDETDLVDIISWNTIISCYGFSDAPKAAFLLFQKMKASGLKPNRVTFVSLLSACSHAGMLDEGLHYFEIMTKQYGIIPDVAHYTCLVDNMGRRGELYRAYQFIKEMPIEPDDRIWSALLVSCRIHGNLELAEIAAKQLVELNPTHSGYWVLLSNIYADASRWEDVANVRAAMKDVGVKKFPGYSWIRVGQNEVRRFLTADESHRNSNDIYLALDGLTMQLKDEGYVPLVDSMFSSCLT
ncbi:Pentatricopeptide repeat-containing protein [Apostasia shenzhenica]|uniref:Pentatricopeptide repeat-containing protein n=1 Tax=Apostasia shenzhenica TaxID=1088818 RepID=A0A2I0AEY2_9ASPA|nr:Pentatricopeptide repeat-containing protein [Apostasia shenzhenica]